MTYPGTRTRQSNSNAAWVDLAKNKCTSMGDPALERSAVRPWAQMRRNNVVEKSCIQAEFQQLLQILLKTSRVYVSCKLELV